MKNAIRQIEDLLSENSDLVSFGIPQDKSAVVKTEKALGLRLPNSYKLFLEKWGNLGFGPNEYFGIDKNGIRDTVSFTLEQRGKLRLPYSLVIVKNVEGDEYYCLDTSSYEGEECPVIVWDIPSKTISGKKVKSFSEFLLQDIKDFIE